MPSNHLILCCPLLLLPSVFPSIRVFSNELVLCIRWPKYWSFSFSLSPSSEHPGLISFRMDWLDLLAVQGTLKSLLQHHSSKFTDPHCSCPKSPKCLTSDWLKWGLWSLCSDHLHCFKSSPDDFDAKRALESWRGQHLMNLWNWVGKAL